MGCDLLHRGGAEGITGGEDDSLSGPLVLVAMREFCEVRRLSDAVHPKDEKDIQFIPVESISAAEISERIISRRAAIVSSLVL